MSASTTTLTPQGRRADFGIEGLRCKECGRSYETAPIHVCELCFGPLEVFYDLERVGAGFRERVAEGPRSLWRYEALLPSAAHGRVDIGTGLTPLRPAPRLAAELGLDRLWIKNDAQNPSHSFKDRVVSVALSAARAFGYETVACASTGNLANSVAAHAAAVGLNSVVLIPAGLETGKVAATSVYGGTVVHVDGSYDDVNRLCAEIAPEKDWAFVNLNLRPFYAEGSKTIGYEVAEQLGWRTPDAIVAPIASGSLYTKIARAFGELRALGAIEDDVPRMFGGQAGGCSPVAAAFEEGHEDVRPVKPATVAKSLAIGNPADGVYALRTARETGGAIARVPESAVAEGIRLLARTEGIFTEGAGGVTIAALEQLVSSGRIRRDEETVAVITGLGLKTLEVLGEPSVPDLVRPSLGALEDHLAHLKEADR